MNAKFDFDMLKQKLEDAVAVVNKELGETKTKTILKEKTGGAAERSYSFLQLEVRSRATTKAQQVKDRVVVLVQSLAEKEDSKMMSLLAQRVQSAMLMSADPFAKVKDMIQEMIEKLVEEAQKE